MRLQCHLCARCSFNSQTLRRYFFFPRPVTQLSVFLIKFCSCIAIFSHLAQFGELSTQFMLGPDLLVAPILAPDRVSGSAMLPPGFWVHLWSGEIFSVPSGAAIEIEIAAPLGEPPVFYAQGSDIGQQMEKCVPSLPAVPFAGK